MINNIVFLDTDSVQTQDDPLDYSAFRSLGEVTCYRTTNLDEIVERVGANTVVIVNAQRLSRDDIAAFSGVKVIAKFGTGIDNIDLDAATEKGIAVINVPSYGSRAIAQWSLMLTLLCLSSGSNFINSVRDGGWKQHKFSYPISELDGKTIGILGVGSIAREFVGMLAGFDVNLIAYTRTQKLDLPLRYVTLEELARESDILSIHCALNSDTRGLVDKEFISAMKTSAYIVNTARAAIVEEQALLKALLQNMIAGAAFDIFWEEPAPANHPLLTLNNFWLTPHVAWCSRTTRQMVLNELAHRVTDFFKGTPRDLVNR